MIEYQLITGATGVNPGYPTNRWVSEDFIRMKYSDAVANGEVDYTDLTDIDEIIDELGSTGRVTFTTKKRRRGD